MKRTLLILMTMVLGSCAPVFAGQSSAGQCYTIADADSRAACLARAHGDRSRCYAVQDVGKRAMCMAEVGG